MIKILVNLLKSYKKSRHFCILGKYSVVYKTANIINLTGHIEKITIENFVHLRGELLTFPQGGNIRIGKYSYIGEGTRIWSEKDIYIGDHVLISHNVNIIDNDTHPIDNAVLRHEHFKQIITHGHPKDISFCGKKIIIEDDVLICCQAIVLKGVHIGKGSVIGAGAVVTKDIPANCLAVGNPAHVVRYF